MKEFKLEEKAWKHLLSYCQERIEFNNEVQRKVLANSNFNTEEQAINAGVSMEFHTPPIDRAVFDALKELTDVHEKACLAV